MVSVMDRVNKFLRLSPLIWYMVEDAVGFVQNQNQTQVCLLV